MIALAQLLQKASTDPGTFFVGVVDFEESKVIGHIEEPMDVDMNATRLGYPLEALVASKDSTTVTVGFIRPEFGIPEEIVISAGAVSVYRGDSPIGKLYIKGIQNMGSSAPVGYAPSIISRPPVARS